MLSKTVANCMSVVWASWTEHVHYSTTITGLHTSLSMSERANQLATKIGGPRRHVTQEEQQVLGKLKTTCQAVTAVAGAASTGPVRHMAGCENSSYLRSGWGRPPAPPSGFRRIRGTRSKLFPFFLHPTLSNISFREISRFLFLIFSAAPLRADGGYFSG
ncbi:hypothetical protein AVEN_9325-1 [Araneus ventricosus]|uniref:Uncharacterized protein n=1 Tax=Araneus ventricosus TaxID=182803 RepID=A0A4Y2WHQ8_ARAVE|nr:hypothetical protein AVEN_87749-1 [Araneus ventricosus]GBO36757.1 hypothetical protein AVEN_9325-1 [Araneus ventricosus]